MNRQNGRAPNRNPAGNRRPNPGARTPTPNTRPQNRSGRPQNPHTGPQNRRPQNNAGNYRNPGRNGAYISPEERARRQARERARRAEAERRRRKQLAYEEHQRRLAKAERKREFRENLKIFGGRLLVFAVIILIMVSACLALFLISVNSAPDKPSDTGRITYFYGGQEIRSAKTKNAVVGDNVYFCFNDLADYLEMSESGSAREMKFILPKNNILPATAEGNGSEDSIVFLTDKTTIILNGQNVVMEVPNILRGTEIWVCSDFISDFMENVSLTYDAKKREMRISRIVDEEHSMDNMTIYLQPAFTLKSTDTIPPIEEDPLVGDIDISLMGDETVSSVLSFKADVSSYESYMNPEGDLRDAFLIEANEESPLDSSFTPSSLMEVKNISVITSTQYLSEYAAKALEAMFIEMKANEFYSMAVYAGYRSYSDQSSLFENRVSELQAANASLTRTQAEENVAFSVSRPGTDDHQTGLSVDMDTFGCVTTDFQYEAEFLWLRDNAWKFGFILRYPKDKTTETDHAFEPWHYRYVGRYHAQKMHASGLCLEEYLAQIK